MAEPEICPGCIQPLDPDGPRGLCPVCLLRRVIEDSCEGPSVLDELGSTLATASAVDRTEFPTSLPGEDDEARTAGFPEFVGRYRLDREIGRSKMAQVIRGRDDEIGREVAIKVLHERFRDSPEMALRFVKEVQIGGQLAHPGIVPVYEMGTFPDGRPYFVMKLVEGRTLTELLKSRSDPLEDLQRFLSIFEQVCQAVAYAHSRGVIHRDLKPHNVMVGAFGEVQTMDWGLAKLLSTEVRTIAEIVIGAGYAEFEATVEGAVSGTLSYMPPEQARGEIDRIDERADVFALGAILCEILTGRPPYLGESAQEIHGKAMRADLADSWARLDNCGADVELQTLARLCLAPERDDRPREAGEVAAAMTAYFEGVRERLRQAELERVAAETRAEGETKRRVLADELAGEADRRATSERKRRRLQAGLAVAVLVLMAMIASGAAYYQQQRSAHAATMAKVMGVATTLQQIAIENPEDLARWRTALAAVQQAEGVAAGDRGALRQLAVLREQIQLGADEAERDQALLERLVEIRSSRTDDTDGSATDLAYNAAFREARLDFTTLQPAEVGARIKARPHAVALALTVALDDWAASRRSFGRDRFGARRLSQAARVADPDPWRNDLRTILALTHPGSAKAALKSLVATAKFDELDVGSLVLLGNGLLENGDLATAEAVLRQAQRRYPGDVWANFNLAQVLAKLSRRDEAIRFYTAARAIRPEAGSELAQALIAKGQSDEGIEVFRDLVRLRPWDGRHLSCLGMELEKRGRSEEAARLLEQAVVLLRESIRHRPDDLLPYYSLGYCLIYQGKLDEAVNMLRELIRLHPDNHNAYNPLGNALQIQGKLDEAHALLKESVLGRGRDDPSGHYYLGSILQSQGKLDEAVAAYREAIRLQPDNFAFYMSLGTTLTLQGKLDEAVAEYRESIRLKSDYAPVQYSLGRALNDQGKLEDALSQYREAIRLQPNYANAHDSLGRALQKQGKVDEAIAAFREAIRIEPDNAVFRNVLGLALQAQGKVDVAIATYRESIRLTRDPESVHHLGHALQAQDKLDEAIAAFREALQLKPDYAEAQNDLRNALADLAKRNTAAAPKPEPIRSASEIAADHLNRGNEFQKQRKLDEAIVEYREAIRLQPDNATYHASFGLLLKAQGKFDDAISEFREAIRLKPDFARAQNEHKSTLEAREKLAKLEQTIAQFREAIRLKPENAEAHVNLGKALKEQGKLDEAVAAFREAIRLQTDDPGAYTNLGHILRDLRKPEEAAVAYREVIRRRPKSADAWTDLAQALKDQGKFDEDVSACREAIRLQPDDARSRFYLGFALQRTGKADEAIVQMREAVRLDGDHLGQGLWSLADLLRSQGRFDVAVATYRQVRNLRDATPADITRSEALVAAIERRNSQPQPPAPANQPKPETGESRAEPAAVPKAVEITTEHIASDREGIRLNPNDAAAHLSLGNALYRQGKLAEAFTEFREVMGLQPVLPENKLVRTVPILRVPPTLTLEAARQAVQLNPNDAVAHFNLGIVLSAQGKLDEVVAQFREAIRIEPDFAEAHGELGTALYKQGKHNEAAAECREAIRLQPFLGRAHNTLGNALKHLGKPDEAIANYREAIRLDPDMAEAHVNLGKSLSEQGKLEEAIAECREALRLTPSSDNLFGLGIVLEAQGKLDDAIAAYREAIILQPDHSCAHTNLGNLLRAQGKFGEAVVEYREAIRIEPDSAPYHNNLGISLCDDLKDYPAAEREFRMAIRLQPDFAMAHDNLGVALNGQKKLEESIAEHRETIRLQPDYPNAHNNLGVALKDQGKLEEAIAQFREAIRLDPGSARAHANVGGALDDQGKLDEGIAECREAIRLKPEYALAHHNLGANLKDQGKLEEAIAAYHEAIRLQPDYANSYTGLGNVLADQGKLDEAVAAYREAIRLKPEEATAYNNLAIELKKLGKLDEAIAQYRESIRLQPDFALALCNLGRALRVQGDYAGSVAMFRRGHEVGSKQPGWRSPSARWLAEADRMLALAVRLPAMLKGEDRPNDVPERLALGQMCYDTKRFVAATRFWREALEADPTLVEDLPAGHRYNAACAAALAGSRNTADEPAPDEAARIGLRTQARNWLRADLTVRSRKIESGNTEDRVAAVRTLRHWKVDGDLSGIRDAEELDKLPEAERKVWQSLWADVEALLKRALEKAP